MVLPSILLLRNQALKKRKKRKRSQAAIKRRCLRHDPPCLSRDVWLCTATPAYIRQRYLVYHHFTASIGKRDPFSFEKYRNVCDTFKRFSTKNAVSQIILFPFCFCFYIYKTKMQSKKTEIRKRSQKNIKRNCYRQISQEQMTQIKLQLLLHQLPRLVCQQNRLLDLRLLYTLFSIRPVCDLVDVVSDG